MALDTSLLVNIGVGKDNLNDFARKYNLAMEQISDILGGDGASIGAGVSKITFSQNSEYWSIQGDKYSLTMKNNGTVLGAYKLDGDIAQKVVVDLTKKGNTITLVARKPFDGFILVG